MPANHNWPSKAMVPACFMGAMIISMISSLPLNAQTSPEGFKPGVTLGLMLLCAETQQCQRDARGQLQVPERLLDSALANPTVEPRADGKTSDKEALAVPPSGSDAVVVEFGGSGSLAIAPASKPLADFPKQGEGVPLFKVLSDPIAEVGQPKPSDEQAGFTELAPPKPTSDAELLLQQGLDFLLLSPDPRKQLSEVLSRTLGPVEQQSAVLRALQVLGHLQDVPLLNELEQARLSYETTTGMSLNLPASKSQIDRIALAALTRLDVQAISSQLARFDFDARRSDGNDISASETGASISATPKAAPTPIEDKTPKVTDISANQLPPPLAVPFDLSPTRAEPNDRLASFETSPFFAPKPSDEPKPALDLQEASPSTTKPLGQEFGSPELGLAETLLADKSVGLLADEILGGLDTEFGGAKTTLSVPKIKPRPSNDKRFAFVISASSYQDPIIGDLPAARSAAKTYNGLLVSQLGVPRSQVFNIEEAQRIDFASLFGLDGYLNSDLQVFVTPETELYLYFAGHLRLNDRGNDIEIFPIDATASKEAFRLSDILKKTRSTRAGMVHVVLDGDWLNASAIDLSKTSLRRALGANTQVYLSTNLKLGAMTELIAKGYRGAADGAIDGQINGKLDEGEFERFLRRSTLEQTGEPLFAIAKN